MNLLSVPICLRPFKRPRGAMRTQQSDVLLRKKTLGVRRRGTGYFPGKAMPRPLDMLDLPAEECTLAVEPYGADTPASNIPSSTFRLVWYCTSAYGGT